MPPTVQTRRPDAEVFHWTTENILPDSVSTRHREQNCRTSNSAASTVSGTLRMVTDLNKNQKDFFFQIMNPSGSTF